MHNLCLCIFILSGSLIVNGQAWHPIPKQTPTLSASLLSQYDNSNRGIYRVGLGFDNSDTSKFPDALFHIKSIPTIQSVLKIEGMRQIYGVQNTIGSIQNCSFNDDLNLYFGIFQESSYGNWCNYFQDMVGIGITEFSEDLMQFKLAVVGSVNINENLQFSHNDRHKYGITIDNDDMDDIFRFTYTHPSSDSLLISA